MLFSWRIRRQFSFFAIFALVVVLIVGGIIFLLRPAPSCTDQKQNQGEKGVDCGGPCEPCAGEGEDLVIFWTRFFEVIPGRYEVASFVENPNLLLGVEEFIYRFRLYDADNILIALGEGRTFVNPREKFLIFEDEVSTLERIPARATMEFDPIRWKRIERERAQLLVVEKRFEQAPFARASAVIRNQSLFPVEDISLAVILFDASGNALGVSTSKLGRIEGESEREAFFTWRYSFDPPPATIEVLARTNLTR